MIKCIGLYSPIPQSGKSEVAKIIRRHSDYVLFNFAGELKADCVRLVVRITGMPEEDAVKYIYHDKSKQIPGLPDGMTGRVLQQRYGSDFMRDMVDPDGWVKSWFRVVGESIAAGGKVGVVADDMRFENEAAAVSSLGGQLWLVTRPSLIASESANHQSEGRLDHLKFNVRIVNDGTLEDLERQVVQHLPSKKQRINPSFYPDLG
jgi:hypothetical protein